MYAIKNHMLDVEIKYDQLWAASEYFFCLAWLPETYKIKHYKKVIEVRETNIDSTINTILNDNEFHVINPPLFSGQGQDSKKVAFLWRIDYADEYCYFDTRYVGWILWRLKQLKLEPISYKYCPEMKLLLILVQGEIIGGVMGYNISERDVSNG